VPERGREGDLLPHNQKEDEGDIILNRGKGASRLELYSLAVEKGRENVLFITGGKKKSIGT